MTGRRLVGGVVGVAVLEAAACGLLPPGDRLRILVDVYAVQGILLGLGGAFLAVDRPFVAARALGRPSPPEDFDEAEPDADPSAPGRRRREQRVRGALVLILGGLLFGTATLLWAMRGSGAALGS